VCRHGQAIFSAVTLLLVVKGVFQRIFAALSEDPEICAHRRRDRQGSPARRRRKRGTQNSANRAGGLATKIVALVNALGNLARFVLLPGQRHDNVGVERLISGIDFEALIADKVFDNNGLRAT
jgi:hypothetical protein